ncbi:2-oxo acid dehydrogenase subunit E2 [Sphingomonas flavalba]|uniref:2-oxo acid dehydrogenase subunit E2 n=1 Tax=Sphingomonas flavalba TaxID=2559804 RepID=UPI0039E012D3
MTATIAFSGARGAIARHMKESLATAAQLSYFAVADASLLKRARAAWQEQGVAAGFEDLILAALCRVLGQFPQFNGVVRDKGAELDDAVRVSVAIALPGGLMAPALPDLRDMTVADISAARRDMVDRARRGALTVAEMKAGTFTISNLGVSRVDHFTPILNGGQIALLGLGRIADVPAVLADGRIGAQPQLALSLTTDHRVVDGAPSAAFLSALAEAIETDLPLPAAR